MKRRSFLKLIGLAVAAPSSLAGAASGAAPGAAPVAKRAFDIVQGWSVFRPDLAKKLTFADWLDTHPLAVYCPADINHEDCKTCSAKTRLEHRCSGWDN